MDGVVNFGRGWKVWERRRERWAARPLMRPGGCRSAGYRPLQQAPPAHEHSLLRAVVFDSCAPNAVHSSLQRSAVKLKRCRSLSRPAASWGRCSSREQRLQAVRVPRAASVETAQHFASAGLFHRGPDCLHRLAQACFSACGPRWSPNNRCPSSPSHAEPQRLL